MEANINILVLGPVFIPFIGGIVALLLARHNRAQRWLGFLAGLAAMLCSVLILVDTINFGPQTYQLGGWQPPFGIVLVSDLLSALFTFMASAVLAMGLLYAIHCLDKCVTYPTFIPLFLMMEAGLNGAFLTGDLFSLFVFMELMVLSSVTLVAISDDRLGLEAAVKYIFISGMGTLFLLIGIAAIYTTFGSLNMADIAQALATGDRPFLAQGAAVMLMSAFLLKSAVFPFHFWQPDFHTTAPTPVHAVLSSVVVKIGVYGIIRMITLLFTEEAQVIESWVLLLGLIGIFFGSMGAYRTYDGKRMLAYSTIGQIGFILVGIGWGTPLALAAAIIYAFNHAFIKSALLMIMGLVSSRTDPKSAKFKDITGVGPKLPTIIGVLWLLGGMALAGLPPLNGFIGKLALIQSGADARDWVPLALLVGAGILTVMYMMKSWQSVFQQKPTEATVKTKPKGDSVLAPTLLIATCVFLGFYATPLVDLATLTVAQLLDPQIYIAAVGLAGG